MLMKRLVQIMMVAALVLAAPVQAVKRYSCDFETQAQRDRWVLNPVANPGIAGQIKNKWYIGAPGNNSKSGQYGLFVSDNNGQDAQYRSTKCWVYAYDTISLEALAHPTDNYTLVFDYCVMGNIAGGFDGLYLFWAPVVDVNGDSVKVLSIPTSSGKDESGNVILPSQLQDYVIRLQPTAGMDQLNGTSTWKQAIVSIPSAYCDGTPHYLIFAWANGADQPQQPSASVDNILITDAPPCDPPTDLVVTPQGTVVNLSWTGTAQDYEVSAYSYESKTWAGPKVVTGNSTTLSNLPMGQTDFIVRAKCDENFYSVKTIVSKLIYYPDQMCVNYLDLNNAVCYINNSAPSDASDFNDFKVVAPKDFGPSDIKSRHVVHFDRTEIEPRTGGQAKTIPDGELASVRLGNWETGNEAERIEFTFAVDTIKYPVLLLKYMPILEAPEWHGPTEQARFTLDILINGNTIGQCGQADFNATDVMQNGHLTQAAIQQGWHLTPSSIAQSGADVVWKEWTTVGVNLRKSNYQGKNLTARLTTFDCTQSGHFGYAYFTLSCSDGKLKGMKCGEINETFEAPDGFVYRWAYAYNEKYRRADKSLPEQYVLGRSQTYEAGPQDDSLYVVDCMFVQDTTCFFSLYASTLATNPISIIDHQVLRNCQEGTYQVKFDASRSWVQEIDHVKQDTIVSEAYHIESYEWTIEGLSKNNTSNDVSHTFDFPIEGGDFVVTLRTTCGVCESIETFNLHLEPLGPTHETQTIVLCDADKKTGYHWPERTGSLDTLHFDYGLVDSVKLFNPVTSCDSIIYLELVEPVRIYEDTMILPEALPYTRHGKTYPVGSTTLIDTIPFPTTCDTTWVFNLEIYESLIVEPVAAYMLCEGADSVTFVYDIIRGRSQSFLYGFTNQSMDTLVDTEQKKGHYEIPVALDPNMEPGLYNGMFHFTDLKPEFSVDVPFMLTMNYSPVVIAQRWNDVLAIRNNQTIKDSLKAMWGYEPVYNYEFDSVQWFVNGQPIDSANTFNYYAGKGNQLQFGKPYQALLRRVKDGALVFTCEYIPQPVPATYTEMPHLTAYTVQPKQALRMHGRGTAHWYDMLGRRYRSEAFDDSDIYAPATAGYFLLVLESDESREINQVLVR